MDTPEWDDDLIRVEARHIAVPATQWQLIPENLPEDGVRQWLRINRFDIAPIQGLPLRSYWRTATWNHFESVRRVELTHHDVIRPDTPIKDVIRAMAEMDDHPFFFLSHGSELVGLLTVADISSRPVKLYVFGLVSELEIALGSFIRSVLTDDDLIQLLSVKRDALREGQPLERYRLDQQQGIEASVIEYMNLSHMVNVVTKFDLYRQLSYPSANAFSKASAGLIDLRNQAAHLLKPFVSGPSGVESLWTRLDRMEEILFRLGSLPDRGPAPLRRGHPERHR